MQIIKDYEPTESHQTQKLWSINCNNKFVWWVIESGEKHLSVLAINPSQAVIAVLLRVPIYCFAEEYCLNSANLILTSGTQCFASNLFNNSDKFSIIGDFGYVYENYNFDNFNKKFNVGFDKISTTKQELTSFGNIYQLNNQQFI